MFLSKELHRARLEKSPGNSIGVQERAVVEIANSHAGGSVRSGGRRIRIDDYHERPSDEHTHAVTEHGRI
jgi:hypothetical protein